MIYVYIRIFGSDTDGIVEWLSGLFVPDQGRLSLIGHTHRWEKSNNINVNKTLSLQPFLSVRRGQQSGFVLQLPPPTFYVGDVDVELAEFLTSPLHALVHWLHDLLGVLLNPADWDKNTSM